MRRLQALIHRIQAPAGTVSSLAAIAATISASRVACAAKDDFEAERLAEESQKLLDAFEATGEEKLVRQRTELRFARLEIDSTKLDVAGQILGYDQIAETCKSSKDYAMEELSLSRIADISIAHDQEIELKKCQVRLQVIFEHLERDIPGLFHSRCSLWRAHSNENSASILSYLQEMDNLYPLAPLLANGVDGDGPELRNWDIPAIRLRAEEVKLQIHRQFKDESAANTTIQTMKTLRLFVPALAFSKLDADSQATREWWGKPGTSTYPIEEVILERLRKMFQFRNPKAEERRLLATIFRPHEEQAQEYTLSSDWRSLTPSDLRDLIFTDPIMPEDFEARLEALQGLFYKEILFDRSGTQYLIAQLLMTRPNFPTSANARIDFVSAQRRFIRYVDSIPNTSLQRDLVQHVLNARENIISTSLGWIPDLTVEDYVDLHDEADQLLQQYKASHLAKNYSRIAAVQTAKAETILRARQTRVYFENFQTQYRVAESYRDEIRSELSALPPEQALRNKSLSRSPLMGGTKDPLSRIVDLLVNEYLQERWIYSIDSEKYALEIWDQIQTRKSRALNDMASFNNQIPSQLLKTIEETPDTKDLYDNWRSQLGILSDTKTSNLSSPSAVDATRQKLKEYEELMKKNRLLMPVLELMKGKAATAASMAELFKGCPDGVVLIDYFIAHIGAVPNKLCMMIYRVAPDVLPPIAVQLEMNIGFGVEKWINTYLSGPNSRDKLSRPAAYQELKSLYGLIQPAVLHSKPGDLLVLCPTTTWNIHRIPLHAIEVRPPMRPAANPSAPRPKQEPIPLLCRNKIVYTNSHSLLRLGMLSRTSNLAAENFSKKKWKATFFSPLEQNPEEEDEEEEDIWAKYGLDVSENIRPPELSAQEKRDIRLSTTALAQFLKSDEADSSESLQDVKQLYTGSSEVTHKNFTRRSRGSDFIFFSWPCPPCRCFSISSFSSFTSPCPQW